ncbi:YbjQ family protein [Vibrio sp. SS-MA-C1-2]|uniref:YbjQ family protein n=1 Tax=Vibrio sp. SS-MA-C1-2 TaxID=2908646 RepID=UPI001F1B024E|nr:YbjQ family protein [Vibrio sp. SS-MA-C1-2]UJF18409.1 YbjQ family protein [Vibrio sp. SS-MA-C1-2]
MNNRIITTTAQIPDHLRIESVEGIITTSIVSGTNFFRDFFAGFTDFFGGKSNSYMSKLDDIKQEAIEDLKNKAEKMGCNAVIGIAIDVEEISGGDKEMLMVTITGTAAVVR